MMELMGNHLWQSTWFAGAAALGTLLFLKNHARVRYALWLASSIKFLVPFSLLMALGHSIDSGRTEVAPATSPAVSYIQEISQPFASVAMPVSGPGTMDAGWAPRVAAGVCIVWGCGFLAVLLRYLLKVRRVRGMVRRANAPVDARAGAALEALRASGGCRHHIRLAVSPATMEPGVFGIWQPVLLMPQGVLGRLSDGELEAIIAHEVTHVRRRDNLMAAVHMFIEAVFWFYPMVWWIGAMLVRERENACDEAVLRLGKNPQSYAEGILKVCEFCLESPLACVAGVTGADMKKRIHAIMTRRIGRKLGPAKTVVLALMGVSAVATPVAMGWLQTPPGRPLLESGPALLLDAAAIAAPVAEGLRQAPVRQALAEAGQRFFLNRASLAAAAGIAQSAVGPRPSFDTASITPCRKYSTAGIQEGPSFQAGGRFSGCGSLQQFITLAYQSVNIAGGPEWMNQAEFLIDAQAGGDPDTERMRAMLQSLLEERFNLKMHRQVREETVYALVAAKEGPWLTPARDESGNLIEAREAVKPAKTMVGSFRMVLGRNSQAELGFRVATDMRGLAAMLRTHVGHPVLDKTGISGFYDVQLQLPYDQSMLRQQLGGDPPGATLASSDSFAASVATALEEQLGLTLMPDTAMLEFLVIDGADKPSVN